MAIKVAAKKGNLMKNKLLKWLPVLLWMIVIFGFSCQNGNQSGHNNRFVIDLLKHLGVNLDNTLGVNSNFYVRKAAHMTEYFILFILVYRAINEKFTIIKGLIFSLIFVFLYACTDEFHQSFIPERTASFRDVMIDTCGGGLGLLITFAVKHKKKFDPMKKLFAKK